MNRNVKISLTSVDETESAGKAGGIRRWTLGMKLQNKCRSRAVKDLRDVTQFSTQHAGPRSVLGDAPALQV